MANEEQLSILKQGVRVWNKWRTDNQVIGVDLFEVKLLREDLHEVNFANAELSVANLLKVNLSQANLYQANLEEANLRDASLFGANLANATLIRANLSAAILDQAILVGTVLSHANLFQASLTKTNLSYAILIGTNLSEASLLQSNFSQAIVGSTIFGNSDLSEVVGLENVIHRGPSPISTETFVQSKGNIPEAFLRGCGLNDWEIEEVKLYNPELSNDEVNKILYRIYDLRATQALQISPLFISYSHADAQFVDKLEGQLNNKGVRFWRDIQDAKAGRLEKQIDQAISQNRTVLLILSEHSLKSDWVEHEVRKARGMEKDTGRDVLCPIALDDSWKSSPWPARIMEQIMEYNILDFSAWEDDVKFEGMFRKLIDGLQLFYKG